MRARFEQFSLELLGQKTRLLEFGRRVAARRQRSGLGKSQTFTYLGFAFLGGMPPSGCARCASVARKTA